MTDEEADLRVALVVAAQELDRLGLNQNSSGNLSARVDDDFVLVTPTGIRAAQLSPGQMVLLSADGAAVRASEPVPTSEWRLHTELYLRRRDLGAIVHTHSPEATAAAAHRRSVPPVHYVVARFGADELRCADYATYGSADLATNVVDTLGEHGMACLMANHGALAAGDSIEAALALALDVEWFCGVYRRSLAGGPPTALDASEIARVGEKFTTYGQ